MARAVAVVGAGLMLAACGSDDPADTADAGGPINAVGSSVATRDHPEKGTILTDPSGATLYFADQEADGTVRCVDACLNFWMPAEAADGSNPADEMEGLGTITREDNGQTQLTFQGKPLYTFRLDKAAGDVTGDNVSDDFGGITFVWHTASIGGGAKQPDAPAPGGDDGYGY